jgi:small-conductance mechanosensitive channel/CRP-like cAMP-binding protein
MGKSSSLLRVVADFALILSSGMFVVVAGIGANFESNLFLSVSAIVAGLLIILTQYGLKKISSPTQFLVALIFQAIVFMVVWIFVGDLNLGAVKQLISQNGLKIDPKYINKNFYIFTPFVIFLNYVEFKILLNNHGSVEKVASVVRTLLYSFGLGAPSIIIFAHYADISASSLVATSGVATAVAGFALKDSISSILSGVFLNIERPFIPGDWIKYDGKTGEVIDISWRTTFLRTLEHTIIAVPNYKIANSSFENFTNSSRNDHGGYLIKEYLSFHPEHNPDYIRSLLHDAITSTKPVDGRTHFHHFGIFHQGSDEYGSKFMLKFDCLNKAFDYHQRSAVMTSVHKMMLHAGVKLSAGSIITLAKADENLTVFRDPARELENYGSLRNGYLSSLKNIAHFKKNDIFGSLSDDALSNIVENSKRIEFEKETNIVIEDSDGSTMYIIIQGVVDVFKVINDEEIMVGRLKSGDFFGEMSLLTGEKRSATVRANSEVEVLEVTKFAMEQAFKKFPELYDDLSLIVSERLKLITLMEKNAESESRRNFLNLDDLKTRIKSFFRK